MGQASFEREQNSGAQVTRQTIGGDQRRAPIFKVTFIPQAERAANTRFLPTAIHTDFGAPASVVAPVNARAQQPLDAPMWQTIERWASRTAWSVASLTLVVDLIGTFGSSFGLPWRL